MKVRRLVIAFTVALLPSLTYAAGLVPCGGPTEPPCQGCYFALLLSNVLTWLVGILFLVFAIMLVVAGYRLVTSAGNTQAREGAKKLIVNGFIGFVIVLSAWLLIDFVMKQLLSSGTSSIATYGPWNSISCVTQPPVTGP
mgnify:CR=1 FL=1|tara:strand:+ start:19057 stop:19476 length:420 start_codon:yes stop_codon:yes gene_type:complete